MATRKIEIQTDLNNFLRPRNPGLNLRIQDYWVKTTRIQNNRMTQTKMEDNLAKLKSKF